MHGSYLLPSHPTSADGSLWGKKKTHKPYYIYLYIHLYMHHDSHDHSKVRAFATSFHVHMLFFTYYEGRAIAPAPSHHHHVTCVLAMRTIHAIILLGTKPHGTFTNTSTRVDRSFWFCKKISLDTYNTLCLYIHTYTYKHALLCGSNISPRPLPTLP